VHVHRGARWGQARGRTRRRTVTAGCQPRGFPRGVDTSHLHGHCRDTRAAHQHCGNQGRDGQRGFDRAESGIAG